MKKDILAEKLLEAASEAGFTASLIPADQMIFVPQYRKFCEDNLCGNYNRNYACPPYCGTPQEMKERTAPYKNALVLQTKASVSNAMDPAETVPLKKEHNRRSLHLLRQHKADLSDGCLAIMAGPCNLCTRCHMIDNEPCPMEMDRFSCLSAYCIDVGRLAETAGLEISWAQDQASFFSIILF